MSGYSREAEQLAASQEGLSCVVLDMKAYEISDVVDQLHCKISQ
jgi:hypothetical protein